ncbi:MAG: hypothetical protein WCF26_12875 [Candidatus Sulfotelmatobacter sp.]
MRFLKCVASISLLMAAVSLVPEFSFGQYVIHSIAGGGPNSLPALSSSIGYPVAVAQDASGNTYIANSYLSSQILKVSVAGVVTVAAGNGSFSYSGDGGLATSATLNRPQGVFIDTSGNIFIADTDNSIIREVLASTGNIQTVAGTPGITGYAGDGGPATSAQLDYPTSIFVDNQGNIFIADTDNSIIREVLATTGVIKTVAGTPTVNGYSGNGGPATSALLDLPQGVFVDGSGNIFIADTDNSVIREVTFANGQIQTIAGVQYAFAAVCNYSGDGGPAASAQLCLPSGVSVDSSGSILVADTENFVIRAINAGSGQVTIAGTVIQSGDIQTVAGTPGVEGYTGNGGVATSATLNYPNATTVDTAGNIFVADTENFVIREVTASNGTIQTFVGNNTLAYSGDGSAASNAELNAPGAVFADNSGDIYIADTDNSAIRVVNTGSSSVTIAGVVIPPGEIQTIAGNGTAGYSGAGVPANTAELNYPSGVFLDAQGDIFIADTANSAIREVVAATGTIQTVAGTPGTAGFSGDGAAATSAQLANPYAVLVDTTGNIYIADTDNSAIRVVNTTGSPITVAGIVIQPGAIQTIAGTPTQTCDASTTGCGDDGPAASAYLNFPAGLALDSAGNIFIADTFDNAIRKVSAASGTIQTVAGTIGVPGDTGDNGPATSAQLDEPYGVFVDSSGDIFVADSNNAAIREVVAGTGYIQTVAGIPLQAGFSGDGGQSTSAEIDSPLGVFANSAGDLFIADTDNSRIRELVSSLIITVAPTPVTVVVNALQQFTASVTGTSNTNVNWLVNGVAGGNATVGSISSSGLFQAPANVPTPSTVTISAISQADSTSLGSAQATIAVPSSTVTVSVSTNPAITEVFTSTTQSFTASVTGTTNTAVSWYVEGAQGGDSTFGMIDAAGNYTAPSTVPSPATVIIEAVSQADATAIGTESVTLVTAPSASQPAPQTVSPGGTATYSISLNPNTGSPGQAITLSCLQKSLPSGASCVFSQNGTTITTILPGSSAVPFTLAVNLPSTASALQSAVRFWVVAQIYLAFLPLAGIFVAGYLKQKQLCRGLAIVVLCALLSLLIACGGGNSNTAPPPTSPTYTILVQGTTAAQPNPVTITTATLIVQ